MILYILLVLHFMKAYPKQDTGSTATGGSSKAIDVKSQRQCVWPFVYCIALLDQYVVRDNYYFVLLLRLCAV